MRTTLMKGIVGFTLVLFSILLFQGCTSSPSTDLAAESIIPRPVSITATGKAFDFNRATIIYTMRGEDGMVSVAQRLASQLNLATGFTNAIEVVDEEPIAGILLITEERDDWSNEEAYVLTINPKLITIHAPTASGAFYGAQTLVQLIPFGNPNSTYHIPTGTIRDTPRYAWRGAMLDVARHFFSVEDVKRYIDLISYYKINRLHLHLTDDQGWRIEIKSWPNLALHGGSTQVGGGKGGYYTQEQYQDIVAYAASRFITIVPEIDLPSHINAALASYGELNGGTIVPEEGRVVISNPILDGKSKPTELYTGIEVGWSTLRYEKEATFRFVNDVIRELAAITPGPYIHIGGDEAHVTKKEDYIKFINRFREIVHANGKQMIGWEEISQANIDSTDMAQFWTNPEYAQLAASKGARIIMSPSKKVYLDMKYDSTTVLGLDWAALIEVDDAYNWKPAAYVEEVTNIMGVEAPLWSETIVTMDDIEYLAFPRIIAVAEVAWTPAQLRTWDEFKVRLGNHGTRLEALGVDYYVSPKVPWKK